MKTFKQFFSIDEEEKKYKVRIEHPNQKQVYSITTHAKDEDEAKSIAHSTINRHLMPTYAPHKPTKIHSVERV